MHDSDLDQLLKSADPRITTPAGFQRDVWCRIEAAEFAGWKARAARMIGRGLEVLAVPRVALATCTVVALAGAAIGLQSESHPAGGTASYVRSISPFAHTSN